MDRKIAGYIEDRKLALAGRINLRPLYAALLLNLVLAYITYALYGRLADAPFVETITRIGQFLSPSVSKLPTISVHPNRCAFVLSIQWIASVLYIGLLLTKYWPFSRIMKVAVHTWYKQPEDRLPTNRNFKVFALMLFVLACAAGDTGVAKFPTLYNGQLLAGEEPLRAFVAMVNSPVQFPLLAWFTALATVMIYWCAVYVVANWWTVVE